MKKYYFSLLMGCVVITASSQNVGIGISTPSVKLHVADTTQHRTMVLFDNYSTAGNGSVIGLGSTNGTDTKHWFLGSGLNGIGQDKFGIGADVQRMVIDDVSGNVGIGTSNPISGLSNTDLNALGSDGFGINIPSLTWHMQAQGYVQSLFNTENSYGGNGLAVKIAGNTAGNRLLDLSVGSSANTPGTPVMIVRGDGRVGIGTKDPGANLSLGRSWPNQRILSLFDDYAGNNAFGMGIEPNPDFASSRLMIYTGTSNQTDAVTFGSYAGTTYNEAMRVQVNGRVGIGTTTPQSRLHIAGSGSDNQLRFDDQSGATVRLNAFYSGNISGPFPYVGTTTAHPFSIVTNNAYRMFFDASGNVGIGTTTPSTALHVNGTITATAPLNVVSDIRYKKDIRPLENAVNTVMHLKGVRYQLRSDEFPEMNFPAAAQIGFIAQEVEKVIPAIVATDIAGNKSISYTSVIPLLVEAIKEQQQQIDSLKRLVEELVTSKK